MRKLKIAITQREVESDNRSKEARDALSQDWVVYLEQLVPGCLIYPIPNRLFNVVDWLQSLCPDIIILSNGNDWGKSPYRDKLETKIVDWAFKQKIHLLGVCRGMQVLNVLGNGIIEQKISEHTSEKHVAVAHSIILLDTPINEFNSTCDVFVNSFHNLGVIHDGLSHNYIPFAQDNDGVIEGFYHPKLPVLAIQWHPERKGGSKEFNSTLLSRFFNEGAFWNG